MFRHSDKSNSTSRQTVRTVASRNVADLYSYRASRQSQGNKKERVPELIQERQQSQNTSSRRHIISLALGVVIIAVFGYMSWLNNSPKIVVLGSTTEQGLIQSTNVYKQTIIKLLNTSPTNHNKLTLNTENITAELEQDHPELASVSIQSTLFGDSPYVYLQPATPALLLDTNSGTKFVLSASGVALASLNRINTAKLASLHLPLINDQTGLAVKIGGVVLPGTDIIFIQTVIDQLKAHSLTISSLTLPSGASELNVSISGATYYVKFNLESNANQQIGTFLAVRKYLVANNIIPSQYIDVRVLGRAFYK